MWLCGCSRVVLPIPGPLVAILFRAVARLIFRRFFAGVLLQGDVLQAAVARVPVRELSSDLGRGGDGSILAVLASHRVVFPGRLLITTVAVAAIGGGPV